MKTNEQLKKIRNLDFFLNVQCYNYNKHGLKKTFGVFRSFN